MKNLKRVLSLALSGIMLVGMMTVGASAVNAEDFTDADEITHTEAVSIATALKIIDGMDDGSFNPNGNVTRGQMAKMITRAMYGGEDPILGTKTTPTFTDIKGRWDESYIEYCASAGIVSGRGDGTFDPEGTVTGTEAAKMLLVALGYDSTVYEFTGMDWAINTNRIANSIDAKLYDGLKGLDPNKAINRDGVAQMVYNTLNAKTKEMRPTTSTNGTVEYTYYNGDTLLYVKYGAIRVEGVVTANEFSNNAETQKGKTVLTLLNEDEIEETLDKSITNRTVTVSSGKDEFGKAVVVYLKPSAATPGNLSKGEVISDVILGDNEVYTTTKSFDSTTNTVAKFVDKNGLKLDASTTYLKNYAAEGAPNSGTANSNGTEFIIIDNDGDGEVEYVLQNTYAFGQVTKYSTKDDGAVTVKTASGNTALTPNNAELKNIVAYEDIAVDDFVNVTKVSDTYYITKANTVEGTIEAIKVSGTPSTTVDGTAYNHSAVAIADGAFDGLKLMNEISAQSYLGEEVTLYLDACGYAIAGTTEAATDYLFVANAAWNNSASSLNSGVLNVFAYLEDGSAQSYVVNKIGANKPDASNAVSTVEGKVWKYSLTSNGQLNLTAVANTNGATGKNVEYKKGESTLKIDGAETFVTNDTVVFFVTLDTVTTGNVTSNATTIDNVQVYTGKTAPSMKYTTHGTNPIISGSKYYEGIVTVANANVAKNNDVVVFVTASANGDDNWMYLVNYVNTVSDGAVYNAVVDGEFVRITTNDKNLVTGLPKAVNYTTDGDLYVIGSPVTNKARGMVTLIDDRSVVLDQTSEYLKTSNTVSAFLDGGDTLVDVAVSKNDIVEIIYNNSTDREIKGIFILAEYDDTDTGIAYTTDGATKSDETGVDYDIANTVTTVDDVKALFKTGKGTAKMLVASSTDLTDKTVAQVKALTEVASISAGDTYKLIVINESETGYKAYTVKVAGAHVHANAVQTPAKDATCTAKGTQGYWTCPGCNKVFEEQACTTETSIPARVINEDATNHEDASGASTLDWKVAEAADVTAAGQNPGFAAGDHIQVCTGCGAVTAHHTAGEHASAGSDCDQ